MTVDSIERCGLSPDMLILTRIAALAASDAPPISYVAHIEPALHADLTAERLQDVLVAIAPIVGTARVMTAAAHRQQHPARGVPQELRPDPPRRCGGLLPQPDGQS
ncbi:carboxymuconolactone decarboxylase family protein [Streptomyces sp. NBC_01762]|uniref:carboxymuconolactone decarboxylase family protein n=1 Tax=unclassified Streptomyces TaxID=2593676 RepID=UPI002DDC47D7|nr:MULTISPECIES: carboxymuconolactone decarboxylase family protein [unclassified Streptomyces]WSC49532.1 carboxymuconolactone decarboxylase family protein [Streptomyces sp. NBC_01762]WSD29104.1 carboxymuconolactone decarboxylase family protein [Streptomyces sp. NBC_01751]